MKHLLNYLTVNLLFMPLLCWGFNNSFSPAADSIQDPSAQAPKGKGIQTNGYRIRTVVVDAGHGGHDPGCSGRNSREKHLALAVSLKVADLLRKRYPEIKVILTRDRDVFVPLYERAAIANRAKADLFLSVHCNFMPKLDWVRGSETYVMGLHTAEHNLKVAKRENAAILLEADYEKNYDYDPNSPEGHIMLSMVLNVFLDQSILFAELVEKQIHEHAGRKSRGVKQAGFVVLKETMMPSVLIETGFLSNAGEEQYLMTQGGQSSIAQSIVKAFSEYRTAVEEMPQELALLPADQTLPQVESIGVQAVPPAPEPKVVKSDLVENDGDRSYSWARSNQTARGPYGTFDPVARSGSAPSAPSGSFRKSTRAPTTVLVKESNGSPGTEENEFPPYRDDLPVQYRIQLAASREPLPADQHPFASIGKPVEVILEKGFYKYQVFQVADLKEGQELVGLLRLRGFADAFLVAYQQGRRVEVPLSSSLEK